MQAVCTVYGARKMEGELSLIAWCEDACALGASLGVPPTKIGGDFTEQETVLSHEKHYDLERYRERFYGAAQKGTLLWLGLFRPTSEKAYAMFDWSFCAMMGQDRFAGYSSVTGISVKSDGPSCMGLSNWRREAAHLSHRYVHPHYGYVVQMPRKFMPAGFALGIASDAPAEFVYDANSWSRFAGKQCDHVIRNVFGYNILNPRHLEIDVGGQRLGDWIEASGDRGRLERQEDGLILWTFQEGDDEDAFLRWDYPPVVAVREQLKEHKVFPWQHLPGVE